MNAGIYTITDHEGRQYIGSSANLVKRKRAHFGKLRTGKHPNPKLQAAWSKHGAESFEFNTLLICDTDTLLTYEQLVIDGLHPHYNLRVEASSNLGMKFSEEGRQNMSEGKKLLYQDPAERAKCATWTGRSHNEEAKMRETAQKPEVKAAHSAGGKIAGKLNKGRKAKPEVKDQMTASQRERYTKNPQLREVIAESNRRRTGMKYKRRERA